MRHLVLTIAYLLISTSALAQTVKNPRTVVLTCDDSAAPTTLSCADAAQVTAYEIDIVRADNSVAQTLFVAAPQPDSNKQMTLSMNVQPFAFGTYTVVARAVVGTVKTADSPKSDPWDRAPGPPSKPLVQ